MKIYLSIVLFVIALWHFAFIAPALAGETLSAAKIFSHNCASCHIGGSNVLIGEKTLKKEALSKYLANYDTNSIQAIINQLQNGKNAMPAFKDKLSEQELIDVAVYVHQKAQQGW
ncbi:MAG: c-type cytochrome [Rhizonema sp. NSF051]|nr:c-type cytochrome [Rhizonema sp. NSF051]